VPDREGHRYSVAICHQFATISYTKYDVQIKFYNSSLNISKNKWLNITFIEHTEN